MTSYLGQIKNRIEINKHKLESLEEYKNALLADNGGIDKELLDDRLLQIETEFDRIKKIIHNNKNAVAHYDAAYSHLLELRLLDNKLKSATDPTTKSALENDIIEHTNKLQGHLSVIPEKLITELQDAYRKYDAENPLLEPTVVTNQETPSSAVDFTNSMIYLKLLDIFEMEKNEFNDIKVFNNPEELENFLDKYKRMKMDCYTSLALINNIGDRIEKPEIAIDEEFSVETESPKKFVETPADQNAQAISTLPIITMLRLVDGLEITKYQDKKLTPTNIKASEQFKEELRVGTWLYNIIHLSVNLTSEPNISDTKVIENAKETEVNARRFTILNDRISKLSTVDIMSLYKEYYSTPGMASMPTVLKALITEKAEQID